MKSPYLIVLLNWNHTKWFASNVTSNLIIQFANPKVFDLCIFWEKKYKTLKKNGYFSRFSIGFSIKLLGCLLSLISRFYSDVQVLTVLSGTWVILKTHLPLALGHFLLWFWCIFLRLSLLFLNGIPVSQMLDPLTWSSVYMWAQLYLILCHPMDCSPSGSSVHGIFQARILECIAVSFSRGSSRPRDQTLSHRLRLLHWQADSLPLAPPGKPTLILCMLSFLHIFPYVVGDFDLIS